MHERIAGAIKLARGKRSAQWLADRTADLGYPITRAQIANYESGRKQSLDIAELLVLAAALDTSPVCLVYPGPYQNKLEVMPRRHSEELDAAQWFSGIEWHSVAAVNADNQGAAHWDEATDNLRMWRRLRDRELERTKARFRMVRENRIDDPESREHGKITDTKRGEIFYATTYVRLHSGKLRERVASSRKSPEDARRELKRRIAAELEAGEPTGVINRRTTLSELFEAWIPAKIAEDKIGDRTATLYRDTWRLHGDDELGELLISELTTSRADSHLKSLPSSAATYMRIILVGMYGLATRFDVVKHNPMRETKTAKAERKPARALTSMEFVQVRQAVKVWCERKGPGPRRGQMLPAFVELLAATGVRPGEVLGLQWSDVDLLGKPPTVTVSGTVVDSGRITGKPLHRQDERKGGAPAHTVTLPKFGVQVLTELYGVTGPAGTVLKNRNGGLVSLSNIRSSLREALASHEDLKWVTPHSFRRTTGTVVRDGLGVEAAQQQLGHAQLATTEAHYVQRKTTGPDTRDVLDEWASNKAG